MCVKGSKNLYRLFLNNHNIIAGTDSRFQITFPSWIPCNKECFVYIETAQVQIKVNGGIHITDDVIMLNSNLQTNRIDSQNYDAIGTQLAQFNLPLLDGHSGADDYLKLDNPTSPIYVSSLPNSVEFWLSNNQTNTALTITNGSVDFVLCIDFIEE